MRTLVALLAAFTMFSVAQAEDTPWYKVVSKKGGLAAMMPGKPEIKSKEDGEQILLALDGGASGYMIHWNKLDVEVDIEDKGQTKKALDAIQQALLKGMAGTKLVSAEDDTFDDLPCREIELSVPDLGSYYSLLILDGEKLYQVTALGKEEFVEADDAEAFFASFRLLED